MKTGEKERSHEKRNQGILLTYEIEGGDDIQQVEERVKRRLGIQKDIALSHMTYNVERDLPFTDSYMLCVHIHIHIRIRR
jgi:hypothetical protein